MKIAEGLFIFKKGVMFYDSFFIWNKLTYIK